MKTAVTFSTFDLLHAGHVAMLKDAKQCCDWLICGLHVDPQVERPEKNAPVQSIVERYIQLAGCQYVDEIVPYVLESDLFDILLTYKPDVRVIGDDYRDVDFSGKDLCTQHNIEIVYNSRSHRYSSSGLRKIIQQIENDKEQR